MQAESSVSRQAVDSPPDDRSLCVEMKLVQRLLLAEGLRFDSHMHSAYEVQRLRANCCPLNPASFTIDDCPQQQRASLQQAKQEAIIFLSLPRVTSSDDGGGGEPAALDERSASSTTSPAALKQHLVSLRECTVLARPIAATTDANGPCRLWLCLLAISSEPVLRFYALKEIAEELLLEGHAAASGESNSTPAAFRSVEERAHRFLFTLMYLASAVAPPECWAHLIIATLHLIEALPPTPTNEKKGGGTPRASSSRHFVEQLLPIASIQILRGLARRAFSEQETKIITVGDTSSKRQEAFSKLGQELNSVLALGRHLFDSRQSASAARAEAIRGRLVSAFGFTLTAVAGGADECCVGSALSKADADGGLSTTEFLLAAACQIDPPSSHGAKHPFLKSAGEVWRLALTAAVRAFCPVARPVAGQKCTRFLANVLSNLVVSLPPLVPAVHKFLTQHCNEIVTTANKTLIAGNTTAPSEVLAVVRCCLQVDVAIFFSSASLPQQNLNTAWRSLVVWSRDYAKKGDAVVLALLVNTLLRPLLVATGRCGELLLTAKTLAEQNPKPLFHDVSVCIRDVTTNLDQLKNSATAELITLSIAAIPAELQEDMMVMSCLLALAKDTGLGRLAQSIRAAFRLTRVADMSAAKAVAARWMLHDMIGSIPNDDAAFDALHKFSRSPAEVGLSVNLWIELLAQALVVPGGESLPCAPPRAAPQLLGSVHRPPPPGTLCWRLAMRAVKHLNGAITLSHLRSSLLQDVIPHLPPLTRQATSSAESLSSLSDQVRDARELMLLLCSKFGLFGSSLFTKCIVFIAEQLTLWCAGAEHAAFSSQLIEKLKSNVIFQLPKEERRQLEKVHVEWLRHAVRASMGSLKKDMQEQENQFKQFELEEKQFIAQEEMAAKQAVEDAKKGAEVRAREKEREKVLKAAAQEKQAGPSVFQQVQRLASAAKVPPPAQSARVHTVVESQDGDDVGAPGEDCCILSAPPQKKLRTEIEIVDPVAQERREMEELRRQSAEQALHAAQQEKDRRELADLRESSAKALRAMRLKKAADDLSMMLRSAAVDTVIRDSMDDDEDVGITYVLPKGGAAALAPLPTQFPKALQEGGEVTYAACFLPLLALELRQEIVSCAAELKAKPHSRHPQQMNSRDQRASQFDDVFVRKKIMCRSVDRPWKLHDSTHVQLKVQASDMAGDNNNSIVISAHVSKDDAVLIIFPDIEQSEGDQQLQHKAASKKFSERAFIGVVDAVNGPFATIYVRNTQARPFVPMLQECNQSFFLLRLTNLATWFQMGSSLIYSCQNSEFWPILCKPQKEAVRVAETLKSLVIPQSIQRRDDFNDFQKRAIAIATSPKFPLVLIDGPPGTGKTHTIHGIISEILRNANNKKPSHSDFNRILVCAPSNVAVDEIMLRLHRRGIITHDGKKIIPSMIRVGSLEAVDTEVRARKLFIDDIISDAKTSAGGTAGQVNVAAVRESLMTSSTIVFTTMGSLRHVQAIPFSVVIVDEAAQTIEPQVVDAMNSRGCKKLILVGDPNQLQAVLLSQLAAKKMLGRSLMQRLLIHDFPSTRLCMQYRMHPAIASFPNEEFYEGTLVDADAVKDIPRRVQASLPIPPSIFDASGNALTIPRLLFIDVPDGKMEQRGTSYANPREADIVVRRMREFRLKLEATAADNCRRVGILTFYTAQVHEIRSRLSEAEKALVHVSTVDGFQGKEKDIIFISCVRGAGGDNHPRDRGNSGAIGFLAERHRMCVALTRAKEFLFVVGGSGVLGVAEGAWGRLVSFVKQAPPEVDFECPAAATQSQQKSTSS